LPAIGRSFDVESVSLGAIGPAERVADDADRLITELLSVAQTVFGD